MHKPRLYVALASLALSAWLLWPERTARSLDDLDGDPVPVLRAFVGEGKITRRKAKGKALGRVIHLADLHLVPKDLFAQDTGLSGKPLERAYAEHLNTVEKVQASLLDVLRQLVEQGGVEVVLVEGLTEKAGKAWPARVQGLREMMADEPNLLKMLHRPLVADQARKLLEGLRLDRLELGPVAQLQADGAPVRVLPLDDEDTLEQADPRRTGGKVDRKANQAREEAQVRRAIEAARPLAVVILGGGHDLWALLVNQGVEYLRVETGAHRAASGE